MFLSEFDCCHKTVQLLKWWNSLHCALFSCCCLLCASSNKNPFLRCGICSGLKWSTPTGIRVQRENGLNTQKQGHRFFFFFESSSEEVICPHRYSETAHSKRTVVLWPARSFIYQLYVSGQPVRHRKTEERFWLRDCSVHFLFKTCSPTVREIDNVWHRAAKGGFLPAESPRLQQSERFTSRRPSIEPGWSRAGAKAQDETGGVWRRNHCPNSKMHITVD